ncbi:MAG: hypothetical protein ACW98Y_14485 [Candidatus Thorarchaeota archaeon]
MNNHEEMWEEEFASLAEENHDEPIETKKKRCSSSLLGILCIIFIFVIGGASIATIITGSPIVHWDSTFLIQGTLFFGGFLVLLACLYLLEGEEKI